MVCCSSFYAWCFISPHELTPGLRLSIHTADVGMTPALAQKLVTSIHRVIHDCAVVCRVLLWMAVAVQIARAVKEDAWSSHERADQYGKTQDIKLGALKLSSKERRAVDRILAKALHFIENQFWVSVFFTHQRKHHSLGRRAESISVVRHGQQKNDARLSAADREHTERNLDGEGEPPLVQFTAEPHIVKYTESSQPRGHKDAGGPPRSPQIMSFNLHVCSSGLKRALLALLQGRTSSPF